MRFAPSILDGPDPHNNRMHTLVSDAILLAFGVFAFVQLHFFAKYLGSTRNLFQAKNKTISLKIADEVLNGLIYLLMSIWGGWSLVHEDWPLETKYMWIEFPNHPLSSMLRLYYIIQFCYYLQQSLVLFVFKDYKKSDFREVAIHHVVTLTLIFVSYYVHLHRLGAAIMLVHDVSDIFLHLAKFFRYIHMEQSTNASFVIFAFVFFVTRILIFPQILYAIWWEPQLYHDVSQFQTLILFGKTFLGALQLLHVNWFYIIVKMIVQSIRNKGVEGDDRSDEGENDEQSDPKIE